MLKLDECDAERISWVRALDTFARREFDIEIIDFDLLDGLSETSGHLAPQSPPNLLEAGRRLAEGAINQPRIAAKLAAHIAVLEAMLGRVTSLAQNVRQTQGMTVQSVSGSDIEQLRHRAESAANKCGSSLHAMVCERSPFGEDLISDRETIKTLFEQRFQVFRAQVEKIIDQQLSFEVDVSFVEIDQYWRFWVDGVGDRFRLRFNRFREGLSASQIDQFVLHELVAHCGQATGWRSEIIAGRLNPIHGLTAVHTWEQSHLEGLAQALPLFLDRDISDELRARVLKDALRQALLNNAYIDTENGMLPDQALAACHTILPVDKPLRFFKSLADQKRHPQLRNYMFAYPGGVLALLASLAQTDFDRVGFLRKSYRQPLTPSELITINQ